jgi:serine/threonine-protein kinase HipA
MQLAKKVGLRVPPTRLENIMDKNIYLIERFDRVTSSSNNVNHLPFISALTITGAHESESSQQSYQSLAQQLRLFGSHFKEDVRELWVRMLFNILCNNTDDHLRNHGFLWDGSGWRLAPAYDILPFPQVSTERYLALGVGKHGRRSTLANALSAATNFGLQYDEAAKIAFTLQHKVKTTWEQTFKESGFSSAEIERIRSCFIACDEEIFQPE